MATSQAGIDALLSSDLSSRMLTRSLLLVLLNQRLFPALPGIAAGPVNEAAKDALAAAPAQPLTRPALRPPLMHRTVSATPPEPPISQLIRLEHRAPRPCSPATTMNLAWNSARPGRRSPQMVLAISEREWQILRCLSRGKSNKLIARELGTAETTVKVHIKSPLRKLRVSNRTQAAVRLLNHRSDNGERHVKAAEAGSAAWRGGAGDLACPASPAPCQLDPVRTTKTSVLRKRLLSGGPLQAVRLVGMQAGSD